MSPDLDNPSPAETGRRHRSRDAFVAGLRAATHSVFSYTLFATFLGYGALCHDLGFTLVWAIVSTALVFAGPAQVILVSTLGSGTTLLQAALAVGISGIRLLPMAVALLPMLKTARTRVRDLILPAHFVAVTVWVEALRLAPDQPREQRIAFCNGLGVGIISAPCWVPRQAFISRPNCRRSWAPRCCSSRR
jgi:predicted branched-subunit amino acid permease